MIIVDAKIPTKIELDDKSAKDVTIQYLQQTYNLPSVSWHELYDFHEGKIGRWESCYHNRVEFVTRVSEPTEQQIRAATIINEILQQ